MAATASPDTAAHLRVKEQERKRAVLEIRVAEVLHYFPTFSARIGLFLDKLQAHAQDKKNMPRALKLYGFEIVEKPSPTTRWGKMIAAWDELASALRVAIAEEAADPAVIAALVRQRYAEFQRAVEQGLQELITLLLNYQTLINPDIVSTYAGILNDALDTDFRRLGAHIQDICALLQHTAL